MKASTKHKTRGKFHELKGAIKAKVGKVTNNRRLQTAGTGEKVVGEMQVKLGQVETILEKK
jgi:uncharacterized protein YjbJ (UPF0337 family)